ncbi:MAG: tagaturonate reductase [Sphingobacteriaceae bacterium]|nr:MAG: tagaturonate reductase [Sphingobacteriaceae bacterium]
MLLSKNNLPEIEETGLQVPAASIFNLPEKVLQFGTGVLLRGLPDYYIDKANRKSIFNGRVAVVKSTGNGLTDGFDEQDNLYTIYSSGWENNREHHETVICSAISRVLPAATHWTEILDIARSHSLQLIISNTTEIGIELVEESIFDRTPDSFPGKLLAVLYERFKAFNGSEESGLVIIPTELIPDNGKKLKAIIIELARINKLEAEFTYWLNKHNTFCNSLVDRIVPGKPDKTTAAKLEAERGYTDNLHIMCEWYSLWAIEGDEKLAAKLSFHEADKGVIIVPDIELFRELKLRLLNATHSLCCAVALLSGFETVKQAMDDADFEAFINNIVYNEILPSIPYAIEHKVAADFAAKVLDRFRNPGIKHQWLAISVQYSTKLKTRVIPLLLNHYKNQKTAPVGIALSFACFLRFMKVIKQADGSFSGQIDNLQYTVTDSNAAYFTELWQMENIEELVKKVLGNTILWDANLCELPGFTEVVTTQLLRLMHPDFNGKPITD